MTVAQTTTRPANRSITWKGAGVDELTRALESEFGVTVFEAPLYMARSRADGFRLSRHRYTDWVPYAGSSVSTLAALIQAWLESLTFDQKCQMSRQSPPDRAAVLHNGFSAETIKMWSESDFEDAVVVRSAWV